MTEDPDRTVGRHISEFSFDEFRQLEGIKGYFYPKRNVSQYQSLLKGTQQAAINFWGWLAIALMICGLILPFVLNSWWWVALIPGGVVVWRSNRKSMEEFFLEELRENRELFEIVAEREDVRVLL
jgi:hypothetical protein